MANRILSFPILLLISMLTLPTLTKARHISIPPSPSPSPLISSLPPSPEAADASGKDQYKSLSPEDLPLSPSASPYTQTRYFPTSDDYSPPPPPPPISSQDASGPSFSPETEPPLTTSATEKGGDNDGGGDDDLWTPPQQPSSPNESSYTRGDGYDGKDEYGHDEEDEKLATTEGNGSGGGHGGRVVFGLVSVACVFGFGGFMCMKRRENDARRRAKYVCLARREFS